jgi:hypothetical protein
MREAAERHTEALVGRITGSLRSRDTLQRVAEELRQRHDGVVARRRQRRPNEIAGRSARRTAMPRAGLSARP